MGAQSRQESLTEQAAAVERVIRTRTGGTIQHLEVGVAEGAIVLTGQTASYYNKQVATHAALTAIYDGELSNNIEVC